MNRTLVSVVAPMWNEELTAELFISTVLDQANALPDYDFELILVNDGSTDATGQILLEMQEQDSRVRCLTFSRNFGHQAAVTAGVFESLGEAVIVMDSDLQDPPSLIPEMLEKWVQGADVVYAVRQVRDGESFFKKMTAKIYYRLLNSLSNTDIPPDSGDFRLMSRRVVEALRQLPERDRYMRGLVAWVGFTQTPVYFDRSERHAGETKYSLRRMLRLGISGVVGFSDRPLYWAIGLGFGIFSLAMFGLLYVLLSLIFGWGDLVRGWASMVVVVMFFSAVQLIFLGVIGIYISKIFTESKNRPIYILDEKRPTI